MIKMLESLLVENLGVFDDKIKPVSISPETVLIGPNNSGKSTFLAGFNLLRQFIFNRSVSWSNEYYNFIDYNQAVHSPGGNRISISATVDSVKYNLNYNTNRVTATVNNKPNIDTENNINQMKKTWYFAPNRSLIPNGVRVGESRNQWQPLMPSGRDVISFLLEKFTERDIHWDDAENWFKKIDPDISSIRTRLRRQQAFFETPIANFVLNASRHGSGFQSIASIISAVVFSPEGSTIIIEEPEMCLHEKTQEIVVDMFNDAVNNHGKQIIFTTHSWKMLAPFISDVGRGTKRGKQHVHADPDKFTLLAFTKSQGRVDIKPIDLSGMKFYDVTKYLKKLWG